MIFFCFTWLVIPGEFYKYFEHKSFSVLGNSNKTLKKALKDYTDDFRTLEGGFHRLHERVKKRLN